MNTTRGVAVLVLGAVILVGPLAPWAQAQQPAPAPAPGGAMVSEEVQVPVVRRRDAYDVAAGVATAVRAPLNVATCVFGGAVGTVIFVLTFGTAYKATTRVLEEGCAQKWVIRGDDLRPGGRRTIAEHPLETYGQERH